MPRLEISPSTQTVVNAPSTRFFTRLVSSVTVRTWGVAIDAMMAQRFFVCNSLPAVLQAAMTNSPVTGAGSLTTRTGYYMVRAGYPSTVASSPVTHSGYAPTPAGDVRTSAGSPATLAGSAATGSRYSPQNRPELP